MNEIVQLIEGLERLSLSEIDRLIYSALVLRSRNGIATDADAALMREIEEELGYIDHRIKAA